MLTASIFLMVTSYLIPSTSSFRSNYHLQLRKKDNGYRLSGYGFYKKIAVIGYHLFAFNFMATLVPSRQDMHYAPQVGLVIFKLFVTYINNNKKNKKYGIISYHSSGK